jgi:hypothetical protein
MERTDHEEVGQDTDYIDPESEFVGGKNLNGLRKADRKSQKQKGGKKHKKTAKKAHKKGSKKKGSKKKGTKKKGSKKAPSKWIVHVQNFAKSHDISFGAAMKHLDCKKTYKSM